MGALELVKSQLAVDAYNLDHLAIKAFLHRKMDDYDQAIATYNSIINLSPWNAEMYAERGLTYHFQGNSQQALKDFDKAIELEPSNGYRYSSRAFIKDYYGDHQGALEDYDKAIALDPQDAVSLNNKGVLEEKLGYIKEAFENFSRSDKITGVDQKLQELTRQPVQSESFHKTTKIKLTPSHFWSTLKQLFVSNEERKNFLRFLKLKKYC